MGWSSLMPAQGFHEDFQDAPFAAANSLPLVYAYANFEAGQ